MVKETRCLWQEICVGNKGNIKKEDGGGAQRKGDGVKKRTQKKTKLNKTKILGAGGGALQRVICNFTIQAYFSTRGDRL